MAFPTVTVTPGVGQTINTLPNAGQLTSVNSLPVVIASDQSAVSVTAAQATAANLNATVVGTGTFATQVTSLPSITIANTSFGATQATASSLNATVVGTGTFAVQAAQSGTWNVALNNSSNTIGYISNPTTIYSAQQTVTASATALNSQALSNGIVITARSTNTGTTYVGPSTVTTSNGYALLPGQSISYGVTNANAVWIVGTASDVVYVTGN
jgi:hypothetical protein